MVVLGGNDGAGSGDEESECVELHSEVESERKGKERKGKMLAPLFATRQTLRDKKKKKRREEKRTKSGEAHVHKAKDRGIKKERKTRQGAESGEGKGLKGM